VNRDADFWESDEAVARFGGRDPDIHLTALLDTLDPGSLRVLDIGCAGGRNAVLLRERGARIVAADSAAAMCRATRARIGGSTVRARMDRLPCADRSFDLVAAIGIWHQAESDDEIRLAIAETARVLVPGGLVLVSLFAREMVGPDARPVPGELFTWDTPHRGRGVRLAPEDLLELTAEAGLGAVREIEIRRAAAEPVERVTLLGLFEKRAASG
jgi:SAM-dependent methyltransferase